MKELKKKLYFNVGEWFGQRAKERLEKWQPMVVVVTGSSGKTTVFSLLEAQLGKKAKYSHNANSVFGISFNILGLERKSFRTIEWLGLIWQAMAARRKPLPKEKIYVVECDCDRPKEGEFLAKLLNPDYVLWLNTGDTHAMNYEEAVKNGRFRSIEEAQAYEYGWFLERAKKGVLVNGEQALVGKQLTRVGEKVQKITMSEREYVSGYKVDRQGTVFDFKGVEVRIGALLPRSAWMGIVMTQKMGGILNASWDWKFKRFREPPSRATIWEGVKNTTLIDSTYNASPLAMQEMLTLLADYQTRENKWAVLSDMTELGVREKEEHENLIKVLNKTKGLKRVLLLGRRMKKYIEPKLAELKVSGMIFESSNELFDYLTDNLSGGEVVLFKGSRFLEDIVEAMLMNEEDAVKLTRREKIWEKRREKFFDLERAKNRVAEYKTQRSVEITSNLLRAKYTARKKIFIVPGWSYDNSKWEPLRAELEGLGYAVKMLEVPGLTGEELRRVWDVDDYSWWLDKQLKKEKEVILIAHSNGGRIAMEWATKQSKKIKKLILIDSAGLIDRRRKVRLKRWAGRKLAAMGKGMGMDNEGARKVLYKVLREKDYLEAGRGGKFLRSTMSKLVETDMEEKLGEIGAETLLIWGEDDGQTPLYQAKIMQRKMPRARLRVIKGARHVPQFTHMGEVKKKIVEFLSEV